MLKIKDFKRGDRVYVLQPNKGVNREPVISEKMIISVGRLYVTTNDNKKYKSREREYLQEVVQCGESRLLFRTGEDVRDYLEKCSLALWIGGMGVSEAEKYTLEQLKAVRQVLSCE